MPLKRKDQDWVALAAVQLYGAKARIEARSGGVWLVFCNQANVTLIEVRLDDMHPGSVTRFHGVDGRIEVDDGVWLFLDGVCTLLHVAVLAHAIDLPGLNCPATFIANMVME